MNKTITLDYESRFLRRKRLTTDQGIDVMIDLPKATRFDDGAVVIAVDGTKVTIRAASEDVMVVRGQNIARLAWHIGNRHVPCEIHTDSLVIGFDIVLAEMLRGLGAALTPMCQPFNPEGGAYAGGHAHQHA